MRGCFVLWFSQDLAVDAQIQTKILSSSVPNEGSGRALSGTLPLAKLWRLAIPNGDS